MTKHRSKPGKEGGAGRGDSDGPNVTLMSDEDLLIHPETVDTDQMKPPFMEACPIEEGCSGVKKIDTLYENTSQDRVDNPREGTTPAPVDMTDPLYPHRRL